jgi:hypothetical protein
METPDKRTLEVMTNHLALVKSPVVPPLRGGLVAKVCRYHTENDLIRKVRITSTTDVESAANKTCRVTLKIKI